jgi:hypothetical protein
LAGGVTGSSSSRWSASLERVAVALAYGGLVLPVKPETVIIDY